MCCLDTGVDHKDLDGNLSPEVLVVADPRNPMPYEIFLNLRLHAAYTAVIFARNPALILHVQRHALLAVSLVRAITQLTDPHFQTPPHVLAALHILYTLRSYLSANRVSKPFCNCGIPHPVERHESANAYDWRCIALLMEPFPGRRLTEAEHDDVQTICRILAVLCALPERVISSGLFSNEYTFALQEACLALLAETVSRDARVQIRATIGEQKSETEKNVTLVLLAKALGIAHDSCPQSQLDLAAERDSVTISDSFDFHAAKVCQKHTEHVFRHIDCG